MNREALVNMRIHSHEISPLQNKHAKQYSSHCKQYNTNCKQYNTHCKLGQNFEEKIDVYCMYSITSFWKNTGMPTHITESSRIVAVYSVQVAKAGNVHHSGNQWNVEFRKQNKLFR